MLVRGSFSGVGVDNTERRGKFLDCWEFSDDGFESIHVETRYTFLNGRTPNNQMRVRSLITLMDLYEAPSRDSQHFIWLPNLDNHRMVFIQLPKNRGEEDSHEGWAHVWNQDPNSEEWRLLETYDSSGASYVRE